MSTVTINKTFKVDGVLTDVTSVKLSDPTDTYGVKRNDTDGVVVANNTSMTKVSTGTYSYTFTEPVASSVLTYTYWVEWVYEGETYQEEGTVTGASPDNDLIATRDYNKYLTWLETEFAPRTLITPEVTQKQQIENAIRYWNTHSAYKITVMADYPSGTKRVQLNNQIKTVVQVLPCKTATSFLYDHPLWTLLGITVIDNVTSDLIMMTEDFKNLRYYIGKDLRWQFEKSDDHEVGGYLYVINVPPSNEKLAVVGTKRITKNEDIKIEVVANWVLYYAKSLIKQIEGNTLRAADIIDIKNDGQMLVTEGKEEQKDLQEQLQREAVWVAFARRK